jgi:hypothetical protein
VRTVTEFFRGSVLGIWFFPSVALNPANPANSIYSRNAATHAEKIKILLLQAAPLFNLTNRIGRHAGCLNPGFAFVVNRLLAHGFIVFIIR